MEYRRCQNGMEDFKNGIEDNLPFFHTNSLLDFVRNIYTKYIRMSNSDKQYSYKSIQHLLNRCIIL